MKKYVYYVRYSGYRSGGVCPNFTGSMEVGVSEEIKSMNDINEIADFINRNGSDDGKVINSDLVFIDFYSLLRVEDEASEQEKF